MLILLSKENSKDPLKDKMQNKSCRLTSHDPNESKEFVIEALRSLLTCLIEAIVCAVHK